MKEAEVKDKVKKILKAAGAWYFMPVSLGMGMHGIPDFCCTYKGKSIYIETKTTGRKPTTLQALCHTQIIAAGGVVLVIDGEDGLKTLEEVLR